ncbi:Imm32 family immunity protein [Streptomyces clavifer]|uniref:Imm32 family immunity protein n=1 Tax=Streptomyces clavifer TaxID=68188 RepID=UPI0038183FBF
MDEPRIKVYGSATEITVAANAAGLRDLAERLMGLADPELRDGYHEHLESGISLEEGSVSLILARDEAL